MDIEDMLLENVKLLIFRQFEDFKSGVSYNETNPGTLRTRVKMLD